MACGIVEFTCLLTGYTKSFAKVTTGALVTPIFKNLRLTPECMSRAMEDFGTRGAVLIRWGINALYVVGMYNVDPSVFIPSFFLNIAVTIIFLICSLTGFSMTVYAAGEEILEGDYPMA